MLIPRMRIARGHGALPTQTHEGDDEMTLTDLRELFSYNTWANEQVIQSISTLSPSDFGQDLKSSHRSIRSQQNQLIPIYIRAAA